MKEDYLKIINEVENVRKKNNKNWMDILRVAFSSDPKKTADILKEELVGKLVHLLERLSPYKWKNQLYLGIRLF